MYNPDKLDAKLFEKLCTQIIRAENKETIKNWEIEIYSIEWKGWDGWVEFYIKNKNGDIEWWQCKFFEGNGRRGESWRKGQISKSIKSAIKNYTKLKEYTICVKNDRTRNEIVIFEEREKEYKNIKFNFIWETELISFMLKYPEINNYFFESDPKRRIESTISEKDKNEEITVKANKESEKMENKIEKIFINGRNEHIEWSKKRFTKYNLAKFRFIDCIEVYPRIKEIENSIDIEDLDEKKYKEFEKDFQGTITRYFQTFKPKLPEHEPIYKYIMHDIWKQIWWILSIWVSGKYKIHRKSEIYYIKPTNESLW